MSVRRPVFQINTSLTQAHRCAAKSRIVEEGNYHKFTKARQSAEMAKKLLDTGDRELVEVSSKRLRTPGLSSTLTSRCRHLPPTASGA